MTLSWDMIAALPVTCSTCVTVNGQLVVVSQMEMKVTISTHTTQRPTPGRSSVRCTPLDASYSCPWQETDGGGGYN